MQRYIRDRYPFLKFIEEPPGEPGGGEPTGKTFTQEEVNAFLARELAPLREQVKALKPAADELTKIKDAQKSEIERAVDAAVAEAQKTIDALTTERDASNTAFETYKRDAALAKVPEAKRDAFKDKSAAEIESALTLASALQPAPTKIPTPLFGGGTGDRGNGISGSEAAARANATALLKQSRS